MKKPKEFKKKKLSLNKDVISALNDAQMGKVKGGLCTACNTGCIIHTCATCATAPSCFCPQTGTCATNCGTCCNTSC